VIWITSASRIDRSGPAFYSRFSEVSAQDAAQTTDGAQLNRVLPPGGSSVGAWRQSVLKYQLADAWILASPRWSSVNPQLSVWTQPCHGKGREFEPRLLLQTSVFELLHAEDKAEGRRIAWYRLPGNRGEDR
jgi:hypothetical protein